MPTNAKTYKGDAGAYWITDSDLLNVTILGVKRDGLGYDPKTTAPSGSERKFRYVPGDGKILFSADQVFSGPPVTVSDDVYEYIHVLYKY